MLISEDEKAVYTTAFVTSALLHVRSHEILKPDTKGDTTLQSNKNRFWMCNIELDSRRAMCLGLANSPRSICAFGGGSRIVALP